MLGSNRLFGFASNAKRAWLAREWGQALEYCGSVAAVMAMSKALLDEEADDSGIKPEPGTVEHDIKYLQIPGTAISLRFWPGSLAAAEYCMDFVVTNSQQPINVPEGYELWVVPDPAMPWLKPVSMRLLSIEQAHGIPPSQIHPGEEKFILRDGLLCLLRNERVGLELHFYVPVRAEFRATPVVEIHRPV
ncbi:hypothetical protein BD414DRAFT_424874 [Trametes punicea]|nr:hypothetical protein BD414DRAFT_424874 [Trametes punicea]